MSARRRSPGQPGDVAVIGLGRFGGKLAESLVRLGHEVLAIDHDQKTVQRWSQRLTHVVQADTTDQGALRELGLAEFDRTVVAIGSALEASVLSVLALAEIGVPEIWARATSDNHAKILSSVGARHVIFPEADIAERVAHLIISNLLDFVEFGGDLAIAAARVPRSLIGRRLGDVPEQERFGVVVIGVRGADGRFEHALPDTVLTADSVLVVEGTIDQVQRFSGAS